MAKRRMNRKEEKPKKKEQKSINLNNFVTLSADELKDIISSAIVEAMIQLKGNNLNETQNGEIEVDSDKTLTKTREKKNLKVLMLLLWPFGIGKHLKTENRFHDDFLSVLISVPFVFVGIFVWLFGLLSVGYSIYTHVLLSALVGIIMWMLGSFTIMAAISFSKEKDSMRLYAYAACMLALVSCIVSFISLFMEILQSRGC